jgi:hypothetical protein
MDPTDYVEIFNSIRVLSTLYVQGNQEIKYDEAVKIAQMMLFRFDHPAFVSFFFFFLKLTICLGGNW